MPSWCSIGQSFAKTLEGVHVLRPACPRIHPGYRPHLHVVDGLVIRVKVGIGRLLDAIHPQGEHPIVRAAAIGGSLPVRLQVVGGVADGIPGGSRPAPPGQNPPRTW
jgi:hypothetical protein